MNCSDLDALEIALAAALTQLMDSVNRTTVLASDRLIVLRFVHLNFLNLLTLHGTGGLRTLQLRSAICESMSCCMRRLPSSVVSFAALRDTYKDGLCRRLLTEIGSTADSQVNGKLVTWFLGSV